MGNDYDTKSVSLEIYVEDEIQNLDEQPIIRFQIEVNNFFQP